MTQPAPGYDSDGNPLVQGVVDALIQPLDPKLIMKNLGAGMAAARGVTLYLPTFETPPQLVAGTETKRDDGSIVVGTGDAVLESIVCSAMTLEKAGEAARRVLAHQSQMPINELTADLLNLAYALIHYENKTKGAV